MSKSRTRPAGAKIVNKTLVAGLFLALITLQVGCFELAPEPIQYGPEASASAVDSALNDPLQKLTPLTSQVGDFVALEETQIVGTGEPQVVGDIGLTVIERSEDPKTNTVTLKWLEESFKYSGEQTQHQVREHSRSYSSASSETAAAPVQIKSLSVEPWLRALERQMQPLHINSTPIHQRVQTHEAGKRSYHDLVVRHQLSEPPEAVRQDAKCGGLAQCQIRTTEVSFSEVTKYDNQAPEKIQYVLLLSPDVPYFARILEFCISTSVLVEGRRYRVVQCKKVRNFKFAAAS